VYESRRPAYREATERTWQPIATYALLGTILVFYIVQLWVANRYGGDLHNRIFALGLHWPTEPWTLVTATLSHGGPGHLLLNGIVLYFFGPSLERLVGRTRFLVLFFVAGALASVLQAYFTWFVFGLDPRGLGASGALLMIFGALMVLMPHEKVLIWGIVPVPFWAAGVGFAAIDVLGALDPTNRVGNVAHLSGLAMGLYVGWRIKQDLRRRGLVLVHG
jgi:uncharacterized protein